MKSCRNIICSQWSSTWAMVAQNQVITFPLSTSFKILNLSIFPTMSLNFNSPEDFNKIVLGLINSSFRIWCTSALGPSSSLSTNIINIFIIDPDLRVCPFLTSFSSITICFWIISILLINCRVKLIVELEKIHGMLRPGMDERIRCIM